MSKQSKIKTIKSSRAVIKKSSLSTDNKKITIKNNVILKKHNLVLRNSSSQDKVVKSEKNIPSNNSATIFKNQFNSPKFSKVTAKTDTKISTAKQNDKIQTAKTSSKILVARVIPKISTARQNNKILIDKTISKISTLRQNNKILTAKAIPKISTLRQNNKILTAKAIPKISTSRQKNKVLTENIRPKIAMAKANDKLLTENLKITTEKTNNKNFMATSKPKISTVKVVAIKWKANDFIKLKNFQLNTRKDFNTFGKIRTKKEHYVSLKRITQSNRNTKLGTNLYLKKDLQESRTPTPAKKYEIHNRISGPEQKDFDENQPLKFISQLQSKLEQSQNVPEQKYNVPEQKQYVTPSKNESKYCTSSKYQINRQVSTSTMARNLFDKQKISPSTFQSKIHTASSAKTRIKKRSNYIHPLIPIATTIKQKTTNTTLKNITQPQCQSQKLFSNPISKRKLVNYTKEKLKSEKNDEQSNFGYFGTKKGLDIAKKTNRTVRNTKETYRRIRVMSAVVKRGTSKVVKVIMALLSKVATVKSLVLVSLVILPIILIASLLSAFQSIMPTQIVLCEDSYRTRVETLVSEEEQIQQDAFDIRVEDATLAYDEVNVNIIGDGFTVDSRFVLCLLAVKHNQNFKDSQFASIASIHHMFYSVTSKTSTRRVSNGDGTYSLIRVITFTITSYSVLEVAEKMGFNDKEIDWLCALLSNEVGDNYDSSGGNGTPLTDAEIEDILATLDAITDPQQRELAKTAISLLGITKYKWGGKAPAGGAPRGLDCSGFVDWVYKTALGNNSLSAGGTATQFGATRSISENDLQVGDLGFWKLPSQTTGTQDNANHVGMYIGKDAQGKNLFIHSQGGTGVVITAFPFRHFKRVDY